MRKMDKEASKEVLYKVQIDNPLVIDFSERGNSNVNDNPILRTYQVLSDGSSRLVWYDMVLNVSMGYQDLRILFLPAWP